MTQIGFSLLVLFLTIFSVTVTVEPIGHRRSRVRAYLEAQCRVTLYPKLCMECLSTTVNASTTLQGPQQLAQITLMASLRKARYTKAYVSQVANQFVGKKARDLQAVRDCMNQINDGVDQITQSIRELRRMGHDGEKQFIWHQSNVQSWVSAALTDATTCIDGFSGHAVLGGKVKATIKAKVLNVAQLTSNALALFNRFTTRHRASHALINP